LNALCKKFRQSGWRALSDFSSDPRRQDNVRQGKCSGLPALEQDSLDGPPKWPQGGCAKGNMRSFHRPTLRAADRSWLVTYVRKGDASWGPLPATLLTSPAPQRRVARATPPSRTLDRRPVARVNAKAAPTLRGGLKGAESGIRPDRAQGPDRPKPPPAGPERGWPRPT